MIHSHRTFATALLLAGLTSVTAAQSPGPAGTVTLPRHEYDRLLDLSRGVPPRPDPPPSPASVARADLRVRITGALARAAIGIDGEVFAGGAARVPILTGGTLLGARLGDEPVPLTVENATHVAILTGPRPFSLSLEWIDRLTHAPGRAGVSLPVPSASSAVATVEIPGDRADVRVSSGVILRRAAAAGNTIVELSLPPDRSVHVSWATRDSPTSADARELRLLSEVRTLVTIGDGEVRLLSHLDLTVVHGTPGPIDVRLPAGYELTAASGATLERSDEAPGLLRLQLADSRERRHHIVVSLHRAAAGGTSTFETQFPTVPSAHRESGEVAVEGLGAVDIRTTELPGMRRVDVREVDRRLAASARDGLLTAYRYGDAGAPAVLRLEVSRFPDAPVLPAMVERAVATTLVTSEGRELTEVALWIRNRAQAYLKVALPDTAKMLSVEVAGEPAKPAFGSDGTRVPLMRPGFRPTGAYRVSFVYLHTGEHFAGKGYRTMTLPRMDIPLGLVEWEIFVPERFRVDRFDGNTIPARLVGAGGGAPLTPAGYGFGRAPVALPAGTIGGVVADAAGAPIAGVRLTVTASGQAFTAVSDAEGRYAISSLPSGPVTLTGQLAGFKTMQRTLIYDGRPIQLDFAMEPGDMAETVTITGNEALVLNSIRRSTSREAAAEPSVNVQALQRMAAGILPVRMDVPRAGTSHSFVKPLVIDEETVLRFRYRRR